MTAELQAPLHIFLHDDPKIHDHRLREAGETFTQPAQLRPPGYRSLDGRPYPSSKRNSPDG